MCCVGGGTCSWAGVGCVMICDALLGSFATHAACGAGYNSCLIGPGVPCTGVSWLNLGRRPPRVSSRRFGPLLFVFFLEEDSLITLAFAGGDKLDAV